MSSKKKSKQKSKQNSKQNSKHNFASRFAVNHLLRGDNYNTTKLLEALQAVEPEIVNQIMKDVTKPFSPSNTNNKMPPSPPSLKNNNGNWEPIDKLVGKNCAIDFEEKGYSYVYNLLGLYLEDMNADVFFKELKNICPKMTKEGYVHCYDFIKTYVTDNM